MTTANAIGTAGRSTGMDLRLRRVALGVSQSDMARHLGVSRQRIGNIEGMLWPGRAAADKYLDALAELDGQ
jgi:DNA-binding XRE family transcriptional regulator